MLGHDCRVQDGKRPCRTAQGCERSDRNPGRLQAGRGCGHCPLRDPKGQDWGQRTRATGNSTRGLGKALENSSGASSEQEHHSGTGIAMWPFLEVQGRPFGLH